MKLAALMSPATWDLFQRLRPHLDLTIDLLDDALESVLPHHDGQESMWHSAEKQSANGTPVREHAATAMRTGTHQIVSVEGLCIGLFPIRLQRTSLGVLVLAAASSLADGAPRHHHATDSPDRALERLGWSVRATIEGDVATRARLQEEQRRSLWLSGILEFTQHLRECTSVDDASRVLLEAVAIWTDREARLYERDLGDRYVLRGVLPSLAGAAQPHVFPATLLDAHHGISRISSIAEMDQLGWLPHVVEVLAVPVPSRVPGAWLVTVSGGVEPWVEHALAVVADVLGGVLDRIETDARERLGRALGRRLEVDDRAVAARAAVLLRDLLHETRASWARLVVAGSASLSSRVLVGVGARAVARLPATTENSPSLLRLPILASPTRVELELGEVPEEGFSAAQARLAEAGADVLRTWLTGVIDGTSAATEAANWLVPPDFETCINAELARAASSGQQAGLIVIDAPLSSDADAALELELLATLRRQLRASDLVGRLSAGPVAALLADADTDVLRRAATRIGAEITARKGGPAGPPAAVLGIASFPSAGQTAAALVEAARRTAEPLDTVRPHAHPAPIAAARSVG